jgi:hypothetical protein
MYRIVPIPDTDYKAVWDTVTDTFITDDNGDQGWEHWQDICVRGEPLNLKNDIVDRISRIWGN